MSPYFFLTSLFQADLQNNKILSLDPPNYGIPLPQAQICEEHEQISCWPAPLASDALDATILVVALNVDKDHGFQWQEPGKEKLVGTVVFHGRRMFLCYKVLRSGHPT
ncbi:hypothetical protein TRIUR3_20974 [Triticum urartu]|uniref:Uncharacterized protein n=1 Tax=Triticum urartu TaxID=4572 RepID=M7ZJG0_TRIUA|nr:hypothetical protein TRIUR3_20974 [Triticum urartu]